jgi:outer membrane protein assembly factor BamD
VATDPRGRPARSWRLGASAAAALAFLALAGCGSQKEFLRMPVEAQLERAREDLAREDWGDAATKFQILAGSLDGTAHYPEVKLGLGRAYCKMKDYPAAERELNLVVRDYAESEWADDAAFTLAECEYDQIRPSQLDPTAAHRAVDELRGFLVRYPDSNRLADATRLLRDARDHLAKKDYENGRLYLRLGDPPAARKYFEGILADYGDTSWAAWAQFGLGEAAEKEGRRDEAILAYRAVVERWPAHELAARSRDRLARLESGESTRAGQ